MAGNGVDDCRRYFREVFFDNPWRDAAVPSWVAVVDGRVAGFAGMMSRPMLFRGRRIRVAVDCNFFVDPALRRSLAALHLGKAILSGPQDLDAAPMAPRIGCGRCGAGWVGRCRWATTCTGSVRCGRRAICRHGAAGACDTPRITGLFAPGAALADAVAGAAARQCAACAPDECIEEPADAAEHRGGPSRAACRRRRCSPATRPASLEWLLRQCAGRKGFGELARAPRAGLPSGGRWASFVYYLRRGGISEVLQLAARDEHYELVLQRLFADAWREGAVTLRGRVDPDRAQQLSRRHCWLRWEGPPRWCIRAIRNYWRPSGRARRT